MQKRLQTRQSPFAAPAAMLKEAQRGHYAVGHFNFNNMEMAQAIVAAAEKLRSPVILATSEGAINYAGMGYLVAIAKAAAAGATIPVALHLDHGRDLRVIKQAIKAGYSSVMIDASREPFEKNILLTRKVVQLAHRSGVSVEAELGTIGGAEDSVRSRQILYTDPARAQEFVARTGCDFLAVAIGTSHGAYKFKGKAHLRMDILKEVRKQVRVPLVLHGASCVPLSAVREAEKYGADLLGVRGVPDVQLKQAVKQGICKFNTDTDLRLAFDAGIRKVVVTEPRDFDPRHLLDPAREHMQRVVEHRIRLFGSAGKA